MRGTISDTLADMLSTTFFSNNRNNLKQQLEDDVLIVITAQSLLQRSGDTVYSFRQDSNFYYLTGINEPDVVLVLSGDDEFLILPKRSEAEIIFGGSINSDEIAKKSGVMTIYRHVEGWKKYKKLQQNRKIIHTLKQSPSKVSGADSFFTNPARHHLLQKLRRMNPQATFKDLRPILSAMRQIKQPEEVAMIKRAIAITGSGFVAAKKLLEDGATEYELEAEFNKIFTQNQVRHGYQPIIAGGERACVLHYIKNDQSIAKKDLCLLDVGAEYMNYSADITRTYGMAQSDRQQAVIQAVKQVQVAAIDYLRDGASWKSYAMHVQEHMGEALRKLNLIQNASQEAIRKYFPHGVSHSLGLDVHDVCDYKTIQENMVITVEPGIYIPKEGIGVRIEDNVLITKEGALNISSHIAY